MLAAENGDCTPEPGASSARHFDRLLLVLRAGLVGCWVRVNGLIEMAESRLGGEAELGELNTVELACELWRLRGSGR